MTVLIVATLDTTMYLIISVSWYMPASVHNLTKSKKLGERQILMTVNLAITTNGFCIC